LFPLPTSNCTSHGGEDFIKKQAFIIWKKFIQRVLLSMSSGAFPRQQGEETEEWVELRLRDIVSNNLNHLQTHPFGSPPYLELHEPRRGRLY